jgi:hypothetical protein
MTRDCPGTVIFFAKADMGGEMVRYRSRNVAVDGAVYQVRAQSKGDGRVQVQVRGGGEAVGELVAPADHLAALGRAVGLWPTAHP